jgi:hypothetical protein
MKPGATRLRRVPETAEELAEMPARASVDSSVASRAIPIDLRPVISAYRKRGRFQLRVEKLPQSARFSVGQNNGDGSWSLLLDELEDLIYFAPKTVVGDHTLAIRLIAKDETEAFTIALIDYTVRADAEGAATAQAGAPLPDDVRNELHKLKALLEARDSELVQLRESAERMGVMLQQKLDAAVADAQANWKREEAARLLAEKVRLEEQFGNRLAERDMRAQAMAEIANEQQASALRMMRQEFAAAKDALAARDSELAASRTQIERVRKDWEAEIASTKAAVQAKAAEALKAAEAGWAARLDKASADLKSAQDAASTGTTKARTDGEAEVAALRAQLENLRMQSQADMAAARTTLESKVGEALKTAQAGARADHDGEMARLRAELERQHQQAQSEIAAASAKAAEQRKTAEAEWQARSDKALAELAAKHAAASAGATDLRAHRDNRLAELTAELERLKRQAQTDVSAARAEAESKAAQTLKAAEAEWKARADKALADAKQGSAGATDLRAHRDNRVAELGAELERQRHQTETEIAGVKAAADAKTSEMLKAAEAEWRKRGDDALAVLTARLQAADAALAAVHAATPDRDDEIRHLQGQIEYLQKWSEAEIAAVQVAAGTREAQSLKDAEAKWQAQSDVALATARCEAAQIALAAADTTALIAERDAEIGHLRKEIERQAKTAEADMAAATAAANIAAGEKLKAAQVIWEQETAGALTKASARFDASEAALEAERRAAAGRSNEDEYVHSLEREIKTLRATLVDREAAIVQTQATQEHMRLGTMREAPGSRWQPLTNTRPVGDERPLSEKDKSNLRLLRDAGVVVMAAAAAVLLFPKLEAMLPNNVRWQIETMGGMFTPAETARAVPAPVAATATQPKAEHPLKYAARSINMRVQPSTGAAIVVNLKKGAAVAVLETRGNWDRVEIPAAQSPAQQGWIFNTYLADTDPSAAQPVATAPAAAAPTPVSMPASAPRSTPISASVSALAPEISVSAPATPVAAAAEPAPAPAAAPPSQ